MSAGQTSVDHVSDTALWVAYFRQIESERPDALFHDPFAKTLSGDRGRRIAESMKGISKYTAWTLAIRTLVIDRLIETLVAEGVDLVLNLGAGLDARPYRMPLPAALLWIEVDYPHMIDHKEKIMARENPNCRLERVRLDLADGEKRRAFLSAAAARAKKVLVLTEGVIPYLSEAQVAELADDLHAQKAFQFWIAEYLAPQVYRYFKSRKRLQQMRNAPFRFFPADWIGFFAQHGWAPRETKYLAEESIKLKRGIPGPWWRYVFRPFVTAKFIQKFRRFSAYVLFQRSDA